MISSVKHISVIILSAIVLLANGGFNVYVDHCHCKNTDIHSIFFHQQCCENEHKVIEKTSDCCKQDRKIECNKKSNCCNSIHKFYKLDNTFKSLTENIKFNTYTLFIRSYNIIFNIEFIEQNIKITNPESPPPLLFGRNLIYFIQNIKIPISDL